MAKQGSTRDRLNPRRCPSIKLVPLTGRRSFGFHQGQRSAYRNEKAGYMTASSTANSSQFVLATPGASIHDIALRTSPSCLKPFCPDSARMRRESTPRLGQTISPRTSALGQTRKSRAAHRLSEPGERADDLSRNADMPAEVRLSGAKRPGPSVAATTAFSQQRTSTKRIEKRLSFLQVGGVEALRKKSPQDVSQFLMGYSLASGSEHLG